MRRTSRRTHEREVVLRCRAGRGQRPGRLHTATITRMVHDPATRAYVERRTAEGLTAREIRRCLKRYLAGQIYRLLNAADPTPSPA